VYKLICIFAEINRIDMRTVTVEIKDNIALSFLNNLESMRVLRVVREDNKPLHLKKKLSEHFAGCLSPERVDELQKELRQMRNE
jgi:uncharacterized protein (DUF2249 family)